MKKTIEIEGKDITFEANAYTPILYYSIFHRDVMREMESLGKNDSDISVILSDLAALMAVQHGKTFKELSEITRDDIGSFLMELSDPMSIIANAEEITGVWTDSVKTAVAAKKK